MARGGSDAGRGGGEGDLDDISASKFFLSSIVFDAVQTLWLFPKLSSHCFNGLLMIAFAPNSSPFESFLKKKVVPQLLALLVYLALRLDNSAWKSLLQKIAAQNIMIMAAKSNEFTINKYSLLPLT